MDHEKDLHSQHVKNAVITPDPPDSGAIGSILPSSISALPATPFPPYKTSPLGYSPVKVKKQIPIITTQSSARKRAWDISEKSMETDGRSKGTRRGGTRVPKLGRDRKINQQLFKLLRCQLLPNQNFKINNHQSAIKPQPPTHPTDYSPQARSLPSTHAGRSLLL